MSRAFQKVALKQKLNSIKPFEAPQRSVKNFFFSTSDIGTGRVKQYEFMLESINFFTIYIGFATTL